MVKRTVARRMEGLDDALSLLQRMRQSQKLRQPSLPMTRGTWSLSYLVDDAGRKIGPIVEYP
jgi:hypothetical protein